MDFDHSFWPCFFQRCSVIVSKGSWVSLGANLALIEGFLAPFWIQLGGEWGPSGLQVGFQEHSGTETEKVCFVLAGHAFRGPGPEYVKSMLEGF